MDDIELTAPLYVIDQESLHALRVVVFLALAACVYALAAGNRH